MALAQLSDLKRISAASGRLELAGAPEGFDALVMADMVKARVEERFLRVELGADDYDAYAAHTPMLIPRLWRTAAKS